VQLADARAGTNAISAVLGATGPFRVGQAVTQRVRVSAGPGLGRNAISVAGSDSRPGRSSPRSTRFSACSTPRCSPSRRAARPSIPPGAARGRCRISCPDTRRAARTSTFAEIVDPGAVGGRSRTKQPADHVRSLRRAVGRDGAPASVESSGVARYEVVRSGRSVSIAPFERSVRRIRSAVHCRRSDRPPAGHVSEDSAPLSMPLSEETRCCDML
jgi:hypothetical protein